RSRPSAAKWRRRGFCKPAAAEHAPSANPQIGGLLTSYTAKSRPTRPRAVYIPGLEEARWL
ncbi:MAG: hypothetical protein ABWK05_01430, partial [Pyrobaculum sp.]